jgi:NADP-reducing hydrogenase subunit HndD
VSKWSCSICGYVYDEAKEGVPFAQLPEDWVCPLCGAAKAAFVPQEAAPAPQAPAAPIRMPEGDMTELSPGALSVLCSNLARGCEKQYKEEEAALFRELAEYFSAAAPKEEPTDLRALLERVEADLNTGYPALSAAAGAVGDRGTLRICVWGEKVTRILQSLLQRYEREGEAFLENTQVWVCSVCGFVYVGDAPPALCPVCKVPAWKFDKVEGRG